MTAGKEKKKREKLSLVVPAYNEEEALPIFYREARKVEEQLPQVEIEYLFVDDGSVDGTMYLFREISARRRPSTRDWKTRREIMWRFWTRIFRIRPLCSRRCCGL